MLGPSPPSNSKHSLSPFSSFQGHRRQKVIRSFCRTRDPVASRVGSSAEPSFSPARDIPFTTVLAFPHQNAATTGTANDLTPNARPQDTSAIASQSFSMHLPKLGKLRVAVLSLDVSFSGTTGVGICESSRSRSEHSYVVWCIPVGHHLAQV